MIDPKDVESWSKEDISNFLDHWTYMASQMPGMEKIVATVDFLSEGIEKGTLPLSAGRVFILARLVELEEVKAAEPGWEH